MQHPDLTHDQTVHLVFSQHLDAQDSLDVVVELVSPTTGSHDGHAARSRTVLAAELILQPLDEIQAAIDPVGLELEEIQPSAEIFGVGFVGKVDEFGERTADLWRRRERIAISHLAVESAMASGTYIEGDMAHNSVVIGESDVGVMLGSIVARGGGSGRVIVDDEGAFDVDGDGAWGKDGLIDGRRLPLQWNSAVHPPGRLSSLSRGA